MSIPARVSTYSGKPLLRARQRCRDAAHDRRQSRRSDIRREPRSPFLTKLADLLGREGSKEWRDSVSLKKSKRSQCWALGRTAARRKARVHWRHRHVRKWQELSVCGVAMARGCRTIVRICFLVVYRGHAVVEAHRGTEHVRDGRRRECQRASQAAGTPRGSSGGRRSGPPWFRHGNDCRTAVGEAGHSATRELGNLSVDANQRLGPFRNRAFDASDFALRSLAFARAPV